jgi:hypothetical protein
MKRPWFSWMFCSGQKVPLVPLFAVLVVQGGVAMEEGAATDILAGNADVVAGGHQRGIGQVLGHAPVHRQLAFTHLLAVVDDLLHPRMQREILRNRGEALRQALHLGHRYGGVAFLRVGHVDIGRPVDRELALVVTDHRIDQVPTLVECGAIVLDHLLGIAGGDHALRRQLVGVELARAGVLGDLLVHQGLRHHRFVLLVVAELAEADDVDHPRPS